MTDPYAVCPLLRAKGLKTTQQDLPWPYNTQPAVLRLRHFNTQPAVKREASQGVGNHYRK